MVDTEIENSGSSQVLVEPEIVAQIWVKIRFEFRPVQAFIDVVLNEMSYNQTA